MTVSSTNSKVQFNGDGSTAAFAYNFKVFADADLQVIVRSSAGLETTKSSGTHYNASGVGSDSGGTVTFTSGNIPASGETVTLIRNKTISQDLDLVANDPFPAASLEDQLDKLTHLILQNNEELDRTLKISKTNTMTSTEFTENSTSRANKVFAFNTSGEIDLTTEIGVNKGNWSASTTYNVRDIVKDTSTNNIFQAITAHTSSGSQPLTTNTDSAKWFLIVDAASATTASTTATNKAADALKIASNPEDSQFTLTDGSTGFSALHFKEKASDSATAAASSATSSASSATASASSATSSASSATTSSNNAADAGKYAVNPEDSQFTLSDGSTTGFSALHYAAKSSASATSSAASLSSFNALYRISSSAPTSSLDTGDLWYDSTNSKLMIYTGSAWEDPTSVINATNERGDFTVGTSSGSYNGSTTVFPATYDVGFIDVYLNGVKLAAADFTATNGTSITLASAATSGDSLQTVAYGTFDSANHYTKTTSDTRYLQASNNLSDVTAATARSNLGLGTLSTQASDNVSITGGSLSNLTALEIEGGLIELKSNSGSVAKIDLYCESSNAHKVTLQPPAHANYSGNVVSTLPNTTGTLINETGATFTGDVTFKQTIDESTPVTSSSNAATIDLNLGNVFTHTLSENVTYTFSNAAASGKASAFILKVTQDSSARTITWPTSVDWAASTAPTITATSGGVDVFGFFTVDGGNTYYGFTLGQALG